MLGFAPEKWTDLAIQALPKTLNTLRLDILKESHVKYLPSNLTQLQLGGYEEEFEISLAALLQIPTSLTKLVLGLRYPPAFQSGWTIRLKSLKTLAVDCHTHLRFDHSDLAALPQSLMTLDIRSIGIEERSGLPHFQARRLGLLP